MIREKLDSVRQETDAWKMTTVEASSNTARRGKVRKRCVPGSPQRDRSHFEGVSPLPREEIRSRERRVCY